MPVCAPPCTFFQARFTRQAPCINHVLEHRSTTWRLAFSIFLDCATIVLSVLGVISLLSLALGIPQYTTMAPAVFAIPIIVFVWNLIWLDGIAPTLLRFLFGGTIYIIEDASGHLGLTTDVGVAEHPNVSGVVEAVIPGILFIAPAELRQFKPNYAYSQIPWTMEAIIDAMRRERIRQCWSDWD